MFVACFRNFTVVIAVALLSALWATGANAATVTVSAPNVVTGAGGTFTIGINLSDPSNAGVGSFQFGLDYDPTIINPSGANAGCSNPPTNPPSTPGTLSGNAGQSLTCNTQTTADPHVSTLLVSDFGSTATTGSSPPPLFLIKFVATTTGPFPKTSPLHFHDAFFFTLSAPLTVITTDGSVQITGTTAAAVTVAGRVLDASGRGLRGVRVTLVGTGGATYMAVTNALGRYSFSSVPSGGIYMASATARGASYATRAVNLTDAVSNLDFVPR
jgi:hypothetical protein